jgi:hypothetical protein
VRHELVDDDGRVDGVSHAEEQVKRLALQSVVGILEAVDDRELVLCEKRSRALAFARVVGSVNPQTLRLTSGIARVVLHDARQPGHAQVLEVVVVGLDEAADGGGLREGGDGQSALAGVEGANTCRKMRVLLTAASSSDVFG